jgi:hypothetical protein
VGGLYINVRPSSSPLTDLKIFKTGNFDSGIKLDLDLEDKLKEALNATNADADYIF